MLDTKSQEYMKKRAERFKKVQDEFDKEWEIEKRRILSKIGSINNNCIIEKNNFNK